MNVYCQYCARLVESCLVRTFDTDVHEIKGRSECLLYQNNYQQIKNPVQELSSVLFLSVLFQILDFVFYFISQVQMTILNCWETCSYWHYCVESYKIYWLNVWSVKRENSLQTDQAGDVTLLKRYWNEASILVKILTAYSAQKAVFFENQLILFSFNKHEVRGL